jgi:hypothetical protein
MEPFTSLFVMALYKATEKIWEKGFDATWALLDETLKTHFARWPGKGEEQNGVWRSQRQLKTPAIKRCQTSVWQTRPARQIAT